MAQLLDSAWRIFSWSPGLGHTFHGSIPPLAEKSPIGNCPSCRAEVPASQILIEYMKEGEQAAYAECPSCTEVVNPSSLSKSQNSEEVIAAEATRNSRR